MDKWISGYSNTCQGIYVNHNSLWIKTIYIPWRNNWDSNGFNYNFDLYIQLDLYNFNSALLAGAIATPGFYTLRFILAGRGHDATEFQEAQSALGLNYSGHSLDWFFLLIFSIGVIVWVIKSNPSYKVIGRIIIGFVLTLIFIVCLQSINNTIFDPIFQAK